MSRIAIIRPIVFGFFSCFIVVAASAQSTISDDPFELSYGSGSWGVLMPSYSYGTDAGGSPAFQDDGDTFGARWQLSAVRRFLGTRTSFETNAFFGWAEANSSGLGGGNLPDPATGAPIPLAAGSTHLESGLNHYGVDVALRDTWRTRFGGLSAGAGFSYMAFDQDFELELNDVRLVKEELDSDYVGGKAFVGWDGCFAGRRSKLDLTAGYYDLSTDYTNNGTALPNALPEDFATTADVEFTTYFSLRGFDTGLTIGAMYISDMPQIIHAAGPASLTTDDAVFIRAMLQIVL